MAITVNCLQRYCNAVCPLCCRKPVRAMCTMTDRLTLPELSTWYLTTNLSQEAAPLEEGGAPDGLRHRADQAYTQMKNELGWTDFMVRSDQAIRRHWLLV